MNWKDVEWDRLRALRERFLQPRAGDYWASRPDLEHYDLAFAPRIACKWRAVWEALHLASREPWTVVDWACGTGIASRTLVEIFPAAVGPVQVWDRSRPAMDFAVAKLKQAGVEARSSEDVPEGRFLLLVSHVANELDDRGRAALEKFLGRATAVVWVEPGTPAAFRALAQVREQHRARLDWVLPCPHGGRCGLLDRADDWCHQFAPPLPEFFTQSEWVRFGREMQIDLRSLPVTFLAGACPGEWTRTADSVVLGRPEVSKSHARALVCRAESVGWESTRVHSKKDGDRFRAPEFLRAWGARETSQN